MMNSFIELADGYKETIEDYDGLSYTTYIEGIWVRIKNRDRDRTCFWLVYGYKGQVLWNMVSADLMVAEPRIVI